MAIADELRQAIDQALAGDWQTAHTIVQGHEGHKTADWIHAVLHKIEGDAGNSRYWYGRAGKRYEAFVEAQSELAAIKAMLATAHSG